MAETKPLIYDLKYSTLQRLLNEWGQPTYRVTQVWQGLYRQLWASPEEFTNLPASLRHQLQEYFDFSSLSPERELHSDDQETTKVLFRLPDGQPVETVLMRYEQRRSLCISSQSGCAMGCVFCATGQMGFRRHLTSGEIVEQVMYFARQLKMVRERITNIVLMGMGEPLHNYDASLHAIDQLHDPHGFNLSERRFTISTVGLIPKIRQFTQERRQINLAISLHAVSDDLRSSILPINRKYPIKSLIDVCRDYVEHTGRRITFEWALIDSINDTEEQAYELARLLKGLLCHVNLIPLNATEKYPGRPTTHSRAVAFCAVLERAGIPCSIRIRRGIDIQAGCGQLAAERITC